MAMLEPKLAILDETDSGLDIDALRIVANGVNRLKSKDNATIVITHYQRLLNYIVPDFVHVLYNGKIVKSGTKELALEIEEKVTIGLLMNKQKVKFKDKLIQAYKDGATRGLIFQDEREKYINQLDKEGFPTIKDEEWKYTNLLPILKKDYKLSEPPTKVKQESLEEYILNDTETHLIVFVNGQYSKDLSSVDDEHTFVCSLDKAELKNPLILKKYWGNCLPKNPDSLVALNSALSKNGTFIYVPKNTIIEKPIQILYITNGVSNNLFLQIRNLIVVEENAQVQITERHQNLDNNEVFTNALTEINAGANSCCRFL